MALAEAYYEANEDQESGRRTRGLWGRMSKAQKKIAMSFKGDDTYGDPNYGKKAEAKRA